MHRTLKKYLNFTSPNLRYKLKSTLFLIQIFFITLSLNKITYHLQFKLIPIFFNIFAKSIQHTVNWRE